MSRVISSGSPRVAYRSKALPPSRSLAAGFLQLRQQIFQLDDAGLNRAREALLLAGDIIEDGFLVLLQLGVMTAVIIDHHFGDLRQEGFVQADLGAKARRPADDHAGDVVAPGIARHDPIRDQEGGCPGMIGDHPVGGEIRFALGIALTRTDAVFPGSTARTGRCGNWN